LKSSVEVGGELLARIGEYDEFEVAIVSAKSVELLSDVRMDARSTVAPLAR
jgi:hypothetical protein